MDWEETLDHSKALMSSIRVYLKEEDWPRLLGAYSALMDEYSSVIDAKIQGENVYTEADFFEKKLGVIGEFGPVLNTIIKEYGMPFQYEFNLREQMQIEDEMGNSLQKEMQVYLHEEVDPSKELSLNHEITEFLRQKIKNGNTETTAGLKKIRNLIDSLHARVYLKDMSHGFDPTMDLVKENTNNFTPFDEGSFMFN